MKHSIPLRIIVAEPLDGVVMKVQRGKSDLLDPTKSTKSELHFEFNISVDIDGESPNFLGEFAQGPKNSRFVYVNSGTYAGYRHTTWARRAKLPLTSITKDHVNEVLADDASRIETRMPGVGPDGGPTCATVKGLEWKVVRDGR